MCVMGENKITKTQNVVCIFTHLALGSVRCQIQGASVLMCCSSESRTHKSYLSVLRISGVYFSLTNTQKHTHKHAVSHRLWRCWGGNAVSDNFLWAKCGELFLCVVFLFFSHFHPPLLLHLVFSQGMFSLFLASSECLLAHVCVCLFSIVLWISPETTTFLWYSLIRHPCPPSTQYMVWGTPNMFMDCICGFCLFVGDGFFGVFLPHHLPVFRERNQRGVSSRVLITEKP